MGKYLQINPIKIIHYLEYIMNSQKSVKTGQLKNEQNILIDTCSWCTDVK